MYTYVNVNVNKYDSKRSFICFSLRSSRRGFQLVNPHGLSSRLPGAFKVGTGYVLHTASKFHLNDYTDDRSTSSRAALALRVTWMRSQSVAVMTHGTVS